MAVVIPRNAVLCTASRRCSPPGTASQSSAPAPAPPLIRRRSGTKDKNYDLITVTHLCLEHVWRLEQYAQDADREGDNELAALFRRMQEHSRKGAQECKQLLAERLQRDE